MCYQHKDHLSLENRELDQQKQVNQKRSNCGKNLFPFPLLDEDQVVLVFLVPQILSELPLYFIPPFHGNITMAQSMPGLNEKSMPRFEKSTDPEELERFFMRLEELFDKYIKMEKQWKVLDHFAKGTYEEFKKDVLSSYDGTLAGDCDAMQELKQLIRRYRLSLIQEKSEYMSFKQEFQVLAVLRMEWLNPPVGKISRDPANPYTLEKVMASGLDVLQAFVEQQKTITSFLQQQQQQMQAQQYNPYNAHPAPSGFGGVPRPINSGASLLNWLDCWFCGESGHLNAECLMRMDYLNTGKIVMNVLITGSSAPGLLNVTGSLATLLQEKQDLEYETSRELPIEEERKQGFSKHSIKAGGNQNKTSGVDRSGSSSPLEDINKNQKKTSGAIKEKQRVTIEDVEDSEDDEPALKSKQVWMDPAPKVIPTLQVVVPCVPKDFFSLWDKVKVAGEGGPEKKKDFKRGYTPYPSDLKEPAYKIRALIQEQGDRAEVMERVMNMKVLITVGKLLSLSKL
ncbi:hypothetical protein ARMSODRAFT_973299 [Armillaria solidipes]|uniref:CCHC-type domain-containing protein n=1 Tax=Armillaria solidipes TaxID=1076256 RepID=A0A2H3C051_9AGAR|nr:hypothetical protein ARMSODRAFT_973299 [Armillaria solidipes]